jgi:hypothetical protein
MLPLPWVKAGACVALAASLVACGYRWGAGSVQTRWDAVEAQRAAQALEAEREARRIEQARASKVQEVTDVYAERARRDRGVAVSARADLERLRNAVANVIAGRASSPTAAGGADGAARAGIVVGECAAALSEVAEAADVCEARLSGLQSYVRAVTQP